MSINRPIQTKQLDRPAHNFRSIYTVEAIYNYEFYIEFEDGGQIILSKVCTV